MALGLLKIVKIGIFTSMGKGGGGGVQNRASKETGDSRTVCDVSTRTKFFQCPNFPLFLVAMDSFHKAAC